MHRTRNRTRSVIATFASMMLVAGMAAMVAAPAAANHETQGGQPGTGPVGVTIKNPGEVVFTLTGGLISVNNGIQEFDLGGDDEDIETDPDAEPVTLTGTVDADGNVHIPAANVVFPQVQLEEAGLNLNVTITAGSPVTGHLDIWTGEFSTNLHLQIRIDVIGLAANCTLNLPMPLSTENDGGSRYERTGPNAGQATLADHNFAIPNVTSGGLLGFLVCPQLAAAFGLPAPAGTNSATLTLESDPVLKFQAVGVGRANITPGVCEDQLGGQWNNAQGVQSCTTDEWRVETVTSPQLNTGGSGTARWRAQVQEVTSTLIQTTHSQQGTLGSHGTDDTFAEEEVELDQTVEYFITLCQQGPALGSAFQNRPLDSAQCVGLANTWVVSRGGPANYFG